MSAYTMPNQINGNFSHFGQDLHEPHRSSQEDQSSGADELFGLPNIEDFDFGNAFDFSQPIDTTVHDNCDARPVSQGELSRWINELDQQNPSASSPSKFDNTAPLWTNYAPFNTTGGHGEHYHTSKQPTNIDPSLLVSPKEAQPPATPKYRTDSGSEIPALQGPSGEWLHPRNMRVLDAQELRWDDHDHANPPTSAYTLPQTAFDPILNHYQIPASSNYEYPDPVAYAPIGQSTNMGQDEGALQPVGKSSKLVQPPAKRRRRSTSPSKALRRPPLYRVESPKNDKDKPWVRINSATKGNTRTGKTNNYGDGPYRNTLHPLGLQNPSWTASNGTTFRYNQWGELNSVSFEAADIERFLYEHPFYNEETLSTLPPQQQQAVSHAQPKLTIWIQKMPGDSAKRVNTQHGLKCRVRECPAGIYKSRTINTGHFRVAFDEQWTTHGEVRNPMHVAGYAHLYCMERFFDFPSICRDFDVRADDRELTGEPTGEWIAGLGQGTDQYRMARDFIMACKTGRGRDNWLEYPTHNPARPTARKMPHANTLTAKMVEKKTEATGHSKMRMMEKRGKSATQFFVNKGDLQMQIDAQQERNSCKAISEKGRRTAKRKMIEDEDEETSIEEEDDYESEGADPADPDGDYAPRESKRRRRSILRRGGRHIRRMQDANIRTRREPSVESLGERRRSQRQQRYAPAPIARMGSIHEQGEVENGDELLFALR